LRIALVYNPNSAGRRLARIGALTRVLGKRGHVVTQHDSMTFRFPRDAPDAELLCLCGGDGTARLVIDGQEDLAALPPLAVYPMGTINLLARELGYPRDARGFAERIESDARSRVCRVGVAGERRFLACASLGADAWVVAGLSTVLKARVGRLAYVASLVRLLWNWPNGRFRVQAGGEVFAAEALFVLRGSYYAGPWTLDREANLSRDALHVLLMPRARRRDLLALIRHGLSGARWPGKDWLFLRVAELYAEADAAAPLQTDGDIVASAPVLVHFRLSADSIRWK
jgi:diacylglycerol kinase (ATP)